MASSFNSLAKVNRATTRTARFSGLGLANPPKPKVRTSETEYLQLIATRKTALGAIELRGLSYAGPTKRRGYTYMSQEVAKIFGIA